MIAQPHSVNLAVRLLLGLVALGAVVTVLTVFQRQELVKAWSAGHPADSSIQPLTFVPVVIVLYIVFAGLLLVLVPFLRTGHAWARWCLVGMVATIALSTLASLRTDPPLLFVVCAVASLPLDGALLYSLLHRDTSAFLRSDPAVPSRS